MSRQFLGPALIFAAVFAGMYALSSSVAPPPSGQELPIVVSMLVATFVTFLFSIASMIWQTVKAGPWAPRTRAHEAHAAIVSTPWWSGGSVTCAGGSGDGGGCGDVGG